MGGDRFRVRTVVSRSGQRTNYEVVDSDRERPTVRVWHGDPAEAEEWAREIATALNHLANAAPVS